MTEIRRQQSGQDCPPAPKNPATQPHPPGGNPCAEIPQTTPASLAPPKPCADPGEDCNCGKKPSSTTTCLEDMIARQVADIAAAENAKLFMKDLQDILTKANAAVQDYTRDKYDALVKTWVQRDSDISELLRMLVCAVPCWRCIIDCYICPLLNDIHDAEGWLYGDGTSYTEVHSLYDLQYWHTRDMDAKDRAFKRIQAVLGKWDKPGQALDKILADNKTLVDSAQKFLGTEPGKTIYDVFFKLVPMHLAMAPPSGSGQTTRIAKEFTDFCACDTGTPDDCCGPDVGALSLRQRLIGPQPYLIDPNDYLQLICCLVQNRYEPAQIALSKSKTDLAAVVDQITRNNAKVDGLLKSVEKNAKAAIPSVIDCCDYDKTDDAPTPSQAR